MVAAARQKNPKKLIALDLFDWKLDIAKKAGADLGGGDHLLIIFITFVSCQKFFTECWLERTSKNRFLHRIDKKAY